MPWHVAKSTECPSSKPWAVIQDSNGEVVACHETKQGAMDQVAALYAAEQGTARDAEPIGAGRMADRIEELRAFVADVDRDLQRTFPFTVEEVRDSGDPEAPKGTYNVRGHASVFDKWSLDLGGFREKVAAGAFDDVLSRNPHVLHLWDHDTQRVLSSTRNKTLELRVDPVGLHYWSRVAPTSYAADLRILLERGDIDQSSFAFTVDPEGQEWRVVTEDGQEIVERTVTKVSELFDVTTTAMGAYPTTDAALAVRSFLNKKPIRVTNVLQNAPADPRVLAGTATTTTSGSTSLVAVRKDGAEETVAPQPVGAPQPETVAPQEGGSDVATTSPEDEEARKREFKLWQDKRAAEYRRTREFAFGVKSQSGEET